MPEDWSDDRISLVKDGSASVITLKNMFNKSYEQFRVKKEKGRGGSCIVYGATLLMGELKREVLLKEFYPFRSSYRLYREEKSLALNLQSPTDRKKLEKDKEKFLKACEEQIDFYNKCAEEVADELVEIQGIYNFGDTIMIMMSAASGNSWDMVKDDSLEKIFETALSLLEELKTYHRNNLLHCDVKPENVYIFRKTRQHVKLLDFGSVMPLKDGTLTGQESIYYSGGFVAPELLKAIEVDDIDREDYFGCITTKTDLFSVGASLYKKVVGDCVPRDSNGLVCYDECIKAIEEFWNLERNGRLKNIPEQMKEELISFFSGILEDIPLNRFNIEDTEKHLWTLLKYSKKSSLGVYLPLVPPPPPNSTITWDEKSWLKNFCTEGADYRFQRLEVWENTRAIVANGGYTLTNGDFVALPDNRIDRFSKFYYKYSRAYFIPLNNPPEITVVADDCLDIAHKWIKEKTFINYERYDDVAVLNMAGRRGPGGSVMNGSGSQEGYLFRCTDYHMFLFRYTSQAEEYNLKRSHHQYPLDSNFGGIFSRDVTVFRAGEAAGYRLLAEPWKVNMIAVPGMSNPRTVFENGEERIAPELVEGVKNKIRMIFRIACDHEQKCLVLGAIGCGAFHNPPKHVAELFRDVLCEREFFGAFKKICFAVKKTHSSNGDANFLAFKEILDGFVPCCK
ncbi:TIGR02452 family protein [bacterium]|nr:TIGR02452 family protein [bacterium]